MHCAKARTQAILLAIALMLVISACGGAADQSEPADNSAVAQEPTSEVTTPTAETEPERPTATTGAETEAAEATVTPDPTPTIESEESEPTPASVAAATETVEVAPTATQVPTPAPALPASTLLEPMSHAYQTWNNCAAVTTSMILSYFGIQKSQEELATIFRPNLDDKHVEPQQLIDFFPEYGLDSLLIEGGTNERIKQLLAAGFPVATPQWLDFEEDAIGHYRVVRGYDDARGGFLVNDSMTGINVLYPYDEFETLWSAFNNRYIPVFRPEDRQTVLDIVGEDADREANVQRTLEVFEQKAEQNPNDAYIWFSVGTGYFEIGDYQKAVEAYERAVSIGLPPKMLWYQFWPAQAYNNVGNHQRAMEVATDQIASATTFGEMRYERGRAFEGMGNVQAAIVEYRRALDDDANLVKPREALQRLGQ